MTSIFTPDLWTGRNRYITPEADFLHHGFKPHRVEMGQACLVVFSRSLFEEILARVPAVVEDFEWPYSTTPLKLCVTKGGQRFGIHFPSYGGTRIANSLEQLAACGYRYVFGLGLGGTLQDKVTIGEIVLLEGAVRGDGASRYYAPLEFPAVADFELICRLRDRLEAHHEKYHLGLSFGTDALYRETEGLMGLLRELGVLLVDLESSAFLTVGRRLGLKCCWAGVVSDRLVGSKHEGNIHPEHILESLLRLGDYILEVVDGLIEDRGTTSRHH